MEEVLAAAGRRALIIGAVCGLLTIPFALMSGFCCSFFGGGGIVMLAGLAGLIATAMTDFSVIPGDAAIGVGASLGFRGGIVASILGGLLSFGTLVVYSFISLIINALSAGDDIAVVIGFSIGGMVVNWLIAGVVLLVGAVFGTIAGVAGGAIVGAVRRQ